MKSLAPASRSAAPARTPAQNPHAFFQRRPTTAFFPSTSTHHLDVSEPDDPHEREADRTADHVVRRLQSPFFTLPGATPSPTTTPAVSQLSRAPTPPSPAEPTSPEPLLAEETEPAGAEPILRMADPWLSSGAADEDDHLDAGPIQRKPLARRGPGRSQPPPASTSRLGSRHRSALPRLSACRRGPGHTFSRQPIRSRSDLARGPPLQEDSFNRLLHESKGRGQPLPDSSRVEMESAFGADFAAVRVHTDEQAARMANRVDAVAFAHQGDIYFNRGQFQPQSAQGRHLLAHELTHVVQQGAAVQRQPRLQRRTASAAPHFAPPARAPPAAPLTRSASALASPRIQRSLIPDWARQRVNRLAEAIPGYTLMTVVVGYNPILDANVEWSARNFFRGAAGLIPFGTLIFDKLNETGAIDAIFNWISAQIDAHNLTLGRVRSLFSQAWDRMDFIRTDPIDYNVGVVRSVFSGFLSDVAAFASAVVAKLIEVFRELAVRAVRALFGDNLAAYDLITQVLGQDPLTGEPRAWNTADFLRAALRTFGFENHLAKMEETGQVEQAAAWIDAQVALLVSAFSGLVTGIVDLWTSLTLERLVRPDQLLSDTLNVVLTFVGRLAQFALNLATKILELIKEVLIALAKAFLHGKPGYRLFTVVLGQDPVTGEEVPRTPANFIRGFLEFVPNGLEIYENLVEGNAIGQAMDWLSAQVEELGLSPTAILERVRTLWESFSIDDLMNPLGAFERVAGTVLGFIADVLTLAGRIALKLLEILFEVVMGSAGGRILEILKRGRDTFRTIVEDPIAFVGNLVAAVKQGFTQFGANIWEHLRTGLFGWLFGALEGAGLQLPQQWNLQGILSLALQVLGLTYPQIRPRLVQHLGENLVSHLETAFEFVRLIATEGLGAAWQKLLEFVTDNLVSIVIDGIKDWVVTRIITAAITRLATMFNPAGAVIQAILAVYNTVMFFIERFQQILALAESVINSISRIASGAIGEAANFVEQSMARTLPVIISFLARLLGLGGISDQIRRIIQRIQAPVSRALDRVIGWVVAQARRLFRGLLQAGTGNMTPQERLREGMGLAIRAVHRFRGRRVGEAILRPLLEGIKTRYSFAFLRVEPEGNRWAVHGRVNPDDRVVTETERDTGTPAEPAAAPTEAEQRVLTAFRAAHPSGRVPLRNVSTSLTVPDVAANQITTHIRNLVSKRQLHFYQSGTNDPYKMVTTDAALGGERTIPAAGRRQLFGYSNPGHDSPTGRTVLAGGIDWAHMPQRPAEVPTATRASWDFLNSARFRSWKTGTDNFTRPDAVLGHRTPANEHWNVGAGMTQPRSANQTWTNQVSTYGGVEERHESSGEGGETYQDPRPPRAARCWWDPAHPEYPSVSGYNWDFTGAFPKRIRPDPSDHPNPLEAEADSVADAINRHHQPAPAISRRVPASARARPSAPAPASGVPMSDAARQPMERAFGRSFRTVRIHTGSAAQHAARHLNARAFAQGSNLYFAAGEYDPHSPRGQHLLAHELTHVAQQSHSQSPSHTAAAPIQRSTKKTPNPPLPPAPLTTPLPPGIPVAPPTPAPPAATEFALSDGSYIERTPQIYPGSDTARKRVRINGLSLPTFKARNRKRFPTVLAVRPHSREGSDTQQGTLWRESVQTSVQRHLTKLRERARTRGGHDPASDTYYFRSRESRDLYLIGAPPALLEAAMVPFWNASGQHSIYQIDHIVEDQLVNADDPSLTGLTSADRASNFELLEAAANGASGQALYHEINRRLRKLTTDFKAQYPAESPLEFDALRHGGYYVTFLSRTFDLSVSGGEPHNYWSHRQILQGQHLAKLEPLTGKQVHGLGHRGSPPLIFLSGLGGPSARVPTEDQLPKENWLPRITLRAVELDEDRNAPHPVRALVVDAYRAAEAREGFITSAYPEMRWPVQPVPGVYGGAVNVNFVRQTYAGAALSLQLRGMSPIRIDTLDLTPQGLRAVGKVLPSLPFIRDADIDLVLQGPSARLRKRFVAEDLHLPPPFQIQECNLEVFAGTQGLGASGTLALAIPNVGQGRLRGLVSTHGGFEIDGEFNFDPRLFSKARIAVGYHDGAWNIAGTLAVGPGRVPGLRSAEVEVAYANNTLTAHGQANLAIPGVQSGALDLRLGPDGFSLGGAFQLTGEIPGIQSGSVAVTVAKAANEDHYRVTARGRAVPKIPGVSTELSVAYDDGALDIDGRLDYQRDRLSGSLEVHATNRAIGDDGQPTGAPTETFTLYGGGQLTLTITPWLKGTVAVTLLPNGELEVGGELALPNAIPVFRRLEIPSDDLFSFRFDFPIFGIPIGPKTIGLKAFIKGSLNAAAGIGPGQFEGLRLGIRHYNPARPQSAHVYGAGSFVVRADASLTLSVDAGIGLDVLIGGVEGSIGAEAGVGLHAQASADAQIDWHPGQSLALTGKLAASITPKFFFNINGKLTAWFAVWDKTWRWNLAEYEYGPDFQLGFTLPFRYVEGAAFSPSIRDIQFTYPNLKNDQGFFKGLFRSVRDRRGETISQAITTGYLRSFENTMKRDPVKGRQVLEEFARQNSDLGRAARKYLQGLDRTPGLPGSRAAPPTPTPAA